MNQRRLRRKMQDLSGSVALCCCLLATGGCRPYALQGLVVSGEQTAVLVLDRRDERLQRSGLAGAILELTLDPASLSPRALGAAMTDEQGRFKADIDQAGAGVLEYELGVLCRSPGHRSLYQTMQLPSSKKRLLVILAPGSNSTEAPRDSLAETLRMAEPYLDDPLGR